jgi:hypothetical protein
MIGRIVKLFSFILLTLVLIGCAGIPGKLDPVTAQNRSLIFGRIVFESPDEKLIDIKCYKWSDIFHFLPTSLNGKVFNWGIFAFEVIESDKYYLTRIESNKAQYYRQGVPQENDSFFVKPKSLYFAGSMIIGKSIPSWFSDPAPVTGLGEEARDLLEKLMEASKGTFVGDIINTCLEAKEKKEEIK